MFIKPIPTRYKGYFFRSRLEARWAVFFDHLKINWRYEPEGFDLGGVHYLPDFWLSFIPEAQKPYPQGIPPLYGNWVEIKPAPLTESQKEKCRLLSSASRHVVYAVAGNCGIGEFTAYKWHPRTGEIYSRQPCSRKCPNEDREIFGFCFYSSWLFQLWSDVIPSLKHGGADKQDFEEAFAAARGARFEFGQSGAAR